VAGSERSTKELREQLDAQTSRHDEAAAELQQDRDAALARANELEQQLSEQVARHEATAAELQSAQAEAAARVAELEGQLSEQVARREATAAELQRAQAEAAARVAELEGQLSAQVALDADVIAELQVSALVQVEASPLLQASNDMLGLSACRLPADAWTSALSTWTSAAIVSQLSCRT